MTSENSDSEQVSLTWVTICTDIVTENGKTNISDLGHKYIVIYSKSLILWKRVTHYCVKIDI